MNDGRVGLRSGAVPLAVRMRPKSLDEVAGQKQLLKQGSPLVALANDKTGERGSVSVILWGPPGTGKTTLAQVIAHSSGRRFVELSAVTAGVRDVRTLEAMFGADDIAVEQAAPAPRSARPREAMATARPQNIGAAVFARIG